MVSVLREIKKNVQGDAQDIKLVDVIDLKFLQEFQDDFAKGMGLASVTVDVDGNPVTNPSYYTRFCDQYTSWQTGCIRMSCRAD